MKSSPRFAWNADRYRRFSAPFAKWKQGRAALKWSNLVCALVFYAAYPITLLSLFLCRDPFFIKALLIPAISFVLLSIFRRWINRPRPYETLDIVPLIQKGTLGKSFPSRHIFSAFLIAATIGAITPWGYLLFLPAALMAIIRVVGGVHYPSDVLAGAAAALIASLFYYI